MKRMNIRLDGDLEQRFAADAKRNRRGPQAETEFLLNKALDEIERKACGEARDLAAYIASLSSDELRAIKLARAVDEAAS